MLFSCYIVNSIQCHQEKQTGWDNDNFLKQKTIISN